ncbi:MAG: acyl-CoA dehydrogenase family protein [Aeromicrobium sp.]
MTVTTHTSDEDVALRRTVADIAERCRSTRAVEGDDHSACWSALVRSGLTELRSPDEDGEPVASADQVAIVVEEMARVVCGAPLVGTLLATELLRLAGVAEGTIDDTALTVVLAADLQSLGGTEGGVCWDAAPPVERAIGVQDGALIVRDVQSVAPGQDLSRPVGTPGPGHDTVAAIDGSVLVAFESFAHVVLAADLLGASAAVLQSAIDYAGQRVQFGQPIGQFQAVQHLCARAHVEVEAQRSALLFAAWSLDAGLGDAAPPIVAKAYAGRAAIDVVEKAVQVFGGVAITWEFPAHRHLRRVLLDAEVLGSPTSLAARLFDEVEGTSHGLQ